MTLFLLFTTSRSISATGIYAFTNVLVLVLPMKTTNTAAKLFTTLVDALFIIKKKSTYAAVLAKISAALAHVNNASAIENRNDKPIATKIRTRSEWMK
jgi:hypothetical protein